MGSADRESKATLKRRFFWFVAMLVVVWLAVMLVGGDSGVLALQRAEAKLGRLEAQLRELEEENARLREEIRRLESDDEAVRRLAREKLMLGYGDEEVILVPEPRPERVSAEAPGQVRP